MLKPLTLLSLLSWSSLWGSDLPPEVRARVVRILATSVGSPAKVACKEPALMGELARAGFVHDPGAMVAYAASDDEVRALRRTGRVVICGKVGMLSAGAGVAVVEEDGRPQIYFHMAHLAQAKVTISDAVLKIGHLF